MGGKVGGGWGGREGRRWGMGRMGGKKVGDGEGGREEGGVM